LFIVIGGMHDERAVMYKKTIQLRPCLWHSSNACQYVWSDEIAEKTKCVEPPSPAFPLLKGLVSQHGTYSGHRDRKTMVSRSGRQTNNIPTDRTSCF